MKETLNKDIAVISTSKMYGIVLSPQYIDEIDSSSEAVLVREYGDCVYRYCLSLVYRREDADDLFQDTYLRAFTSIDKIKASANPQSFLLSIATSVWKSRKRKFARRNKIAPEVSLDNAYENTETGLDDKLIDKEDVLIVRKLVNALPEKMRIPTIMFYTLDIPIADIAETLNLPIGTVKSRLSRARSIIKKGLVKEYGYEQKT